MGETETRFPDIFDREVLLQSFGFTLAGFLIVFVLDLILPSGPAAYTLSELTPYLFYIILPTTFIAFATLVKLSDISDMRKYRFTGLAMMVTGSAIFVVLNFSVLSQLSTETPPLIHTFGGELTLIMSGLLVYIYDRLDYYYR